MQNRVRDERSARRNEVEIHSFPDSDTASAAVPKKSGLPKLESHQSSESVSDGYRHRQITSVSPNSTALLSSGVLRGRAWRRESHGILCIRSYRCPQEDQGRSHSPNRRYMGERNAHRSGTAWSEGLEDQTCATAQLAIQYSILSPVAGSHRSECSAAQCRPSGIARRTFSFGQARSPPNVSLWVVAVCLTKLTEQSQ